MEPEDLDLETKCENMMNIVVESRKRFGKMCVSYEQKTSLMENKILNFQIETFSTYKFKPKHPIPMFDSQGIEELDKFSEEMSHRSRRIEELKKKIKNTQAIVTQLKTDRTGQRLRVPLTAEDLLARSEAKNL